MDGRVWRCVIQPGAHGSRAGTTTMCGCGSTAGVQRPLPAAITTSAAVATGAAEPSSPAAAASGAPAQAALDAKLAEMTTRMAAADGFDAKNAVFHEYFDAVPDSDTATRTAFFGTFMSNIPKSDADRVIRFLEALGERDKADTAAAAKPADTPRPAAATGTKAPSGVLMIGDSLSVGTKQYFDDALTGAPTSVDATGGIPLKEGMRRYRAAAQKPQVVEMALFTNNTPDQIDQLRAAVEETVRDARSRGGRVVWATIKGNPKYGSYDAVNAMLRDLASKNADVMGLVDWAKMVADNPSYLAGDHIHGTPAGYRARAQAFADAARV